MALQIIGENLNIYGSGVFSFEGDRSTWGFSDNENFTAERSFERKTLGSASALVTKLNNTNTLLIPYRFTPVLGRKYFVQAKVFVPSAQPVATDDVLLSLDANVVGNLFSSSGLSLISFFEQSVLQAKDSWRDLSALVQCTSSPPVGYAQHYLMMKLGAGSINVNGQIYVDELTVYEAIGGDDVDPNPGEPLPPFFSKAYLSKNPVVFTVNAQAGHALLTNYRIYCDTRVEEVYGSNVFLSKLRQALPADAQNKADFNLRAALRGLLKTTAPIGISVITKLTDRIRRFKNFTGHLQGTEVVPILLTESDMFGAIFGGLSKYHFQTIDFFLTHLPDSKRFLTWAPLVKDVDRSQEDYLNFYVYSGAMLTIRMSLKAYYDDGTNQTTIGASVPVAFGELFQIPAGPANSGVLAINPAKNLVQYELMLIGADSIPVSEVRTFKLVPFTHPRTKFLMFLNSLGSFETIRITGTTRTDEDYQRTQVQRSLPITTVTEVVNESQISDVTGRRKFTLSTGLLKGKNAAEWLEYMREVARSRQTYLISANGDRLPINIINTSIKVAEDEVYERFVSFEAEETFFNENYTPDSI